MVKKISDKKVQICCSGNCPIIEKEGSNISITDDFGSKAILTEEQAKFLARAIEEVTK